jgi:hypothetical protein
VERTKEGLLMAQLHETGYGRKFFDRDLPNLIKALNKIGDELERANNLKEQELSKNTKKEEE